MRRNLAQLRMTIFDPTSEPLFTTILVLPDCSMMTVASVIDPMRACNRISRAERFVWRIVTFDGAPAPLSCGLPLASQGRLGPGLSGDLLIVIAGFDALVQATRGVMATLAQVMPRFQAVAGIESGSWILGAMGALDGRRATTHWEDLEDFAARFLETDVRADRYVIDGGILTAGGASPAFDLMLHLIRSRFGYAAALDVASVFIYDEAHAATDAQPFVSLGRLGDQEPRVARAIRVMEQALDQPLSTAAVARRVGISVRLLETLFRRTLGVSPGAYYLELRMQAARRLVTDTSLSLREIALRTGFGSLSAFSRGFRRHAGAPASEARRRAREKRAGPGEEARRTT
jgi:transcriptional regulator GlxA family with amidase domain